jgi:hypothetical protein
MPRSAADGGASPSASSSEHAIEDVRYLAFVPALARVVRSKVWRHDAIATGQALLLARASMLKNSLTPTGKSRPHCRCRHA